MKRPIANPLVVFREEFDDWALLFEPDSGKVLGLNQVGAFIWKLFDGQHTQEDIVKEMRVAYRNIPPDVHGDVVEFIQRLLGLGFIGYEMQQGE